MVKDERLVRDAVTVVVTQMGGRPTFYDIRPERRAVTPPRHRLHRRHPPSPTGRVFLFYSRKTFDGTGVARPAEKQTGFADDKRLILTFKERKTPNKIDKTFHLSLETFWGTVFEKTYYCTCVLVCKYILRRFPLACTSLTSSTGAAPSFCALATTTAYCSTTYSTGWTRPTSR